jgi:hypothetical protein
MYQVTPQKSQANDAKDAARKKGKPFCKVCFDASKPESEYTSHYLKSSPGPTGKLVCPTLLNQSCLTCGNRGHTSSYCDQAKARVKPAINVLSTGASIGAEAELKLIASTFRTNQFPALKTKAEQPKAEKQDPIPHQEQEQELCHVYNPKSNPFGALSVKQPHRHKKTSFQPPTTQHPPEEKPMTMAERLKNPTPKAPAPKAAKPDVPALTKPQFADMPSKSQFWWQDEDD